MIYWFYKGSKCFVSSTDSNHVEQFKKEILIVGDQITNIIYICTILIYLYKKRGGYNSNWNSPVSLCGANADVSRACPIAYGLY